MGSEYVSREKKLTMVNFLIFGQKNGFFVFLHYSGIGVFWPKIPLNLTSEGLKYPQEVQVQHETCSTICGTPVQAILDQKNLTGLAGGGQRTSKYGPEWTSLLYIFFP